MVFLTFADNQKYGKSLLIPSTGKNEGKHLLSIWQHAPSQYGKIHLENKSSETAPCPEEQWHVTKEILFYGQISVNTKRSREYPF